MITTASSPLRTIIINDKEYKNIPSYFTISNIKTFYSLETFNVPSALNVKVLDNDKFQITSIQEELSTLSKITSDDVITLLKKYNLRGLKKLSKEPEIEKQKRKGKTKISTTLNVGYIISELNKIFGIDWPNKKKTKSTEATFNDLEKSLDQIKKAYGKLDDKLGVKSLPFESKSVELELNLDIPNKENILEIFDDIPSSQFLPFTILFYNQRQVIKVYDKLKEEKKKIDEWINRFDPNIIDISQIKQGIYFKILAPQTYTGKTESTTNIKKYTEGLWTLDNTIILPSSKRETGISVNHEELLNKFFEIFENKITIHRTSKVFLNIKGQYKVNGINFSKIPFANMVRNDKIISSLLFLDERQKVIESMKKSSLTVYLYPLIPKKTEDAIILSFKATEIPSTLLIKIKRGIVDMYDVSPIMYIISKILYIYAEKYMGIEIDTKTTKTTSELENECEAKLTEEDLKSGKRISELTKVDPCIFNAEYPVKCNKKRQPRVLKTEKEVETFKNDPENMILLKKILPAKSFNALTKNGTSLDDAILNYKGQYYTCIPREEDDVDQTYVVPGFQKNTKSIPIKMKQGPPKIWKDVAPYLICCFQKFPAGKKIQSESSEQIKEIGGEYIVSKIENILKVGRYGALPYLWRQILSYLDVPKIKKGSQETYPYLRYGLPYSQYSFIHCMEIAYNYDKYTGLSLDEKESYVSSLAKKIILQNENSCIKVLSQIFSSPENRIEEFEEGMSSYFNPPYFIEQVKEYYKCNILLYKIDTQSKYGEIVLPYSKFTYIPTSFDYAKSFVLIFLNGTGDDNNPYQCEIMSKIQSNNNSNTFIFEATSIDEYDAKLVDVACKVFKESNLVYSLNAYVKDENTFTYSKFESS